MAAQTGSELFDLIAGHRITATIYVAAKLELADHLAAGALSSGQLAEKTQTDEASLRRLLRALVTLGLLENLETHQFSLTAMGTQLSRHAQGSLRPWALFEGDLLVQTWGGLLESIRTGRTATNLAGGDNRFALLSTNPEAAKVFNEAMVSLTRMIAREVPSLVDFSGMRRVIDVGGGFGELLVAILEACPWLVGDVFDLRHCASGAADLFAQAGLTDRASFTAGDFFESVPDGADALVLKSVIHDWDDDRSRVILKNCRNALLRGAKLILIERIMPDHLSDDPEHRSIALSDLNMLRGPGGQERTKHGYELLLEECAFRLVRVVPVGRFNCLEAVAVRRKTGALNASPGLQPSSRRTHGTGI